MARHAATKRQRSRFDYLDDKEREAYMGEPAELVLAGRLQSFTGKQKLRPYFVIALHGFISDVRGFIDSPLLIDGFVLMCNGRRQIRGTRAYEGLRTCLKLGLLTFAKERGLNGKYLKDWPEDLGNEFVQWLRNEARTTKGKTKGKQLNQNTSRRLWGEFCSIFAFISEEQRLAGKLPQLNSFPNNPFSRARDDTKKTRSLGLPALIKILQAARNEFCNFVGKVHYAQALFERAEVLPDATKKGRGCFANRDAVLWYLQKEYPRRFPLFTEWRKANPSLFYAINVYHGGWRRISEYFHPSSENCVAPIVLLTIYGHFNVEPLRALALRQVKRVSVMRNEHIEVRTVIQPGKNRGDAYRRSFPVDGSDFASPSSILDFMNIATARIRPDAGIYSDCIFIFLTNEGLVRTFTTATLDGQSADSKWRHHLRAFSRRHKLQEFNLSELRQTSLDLGRQIFEDDLRAVLALKGGSTKSILDFHYRSDAAENRANANIAQLQSNKERYVRTNGKSQHQDSSNKDISAATPGCMCADPYDSPIPGEVRGKLCGAFGSCPGCPHGTPQLGSALGLARLLQVRQALIQAKLDLPLNRWVGRYKVALEVLEGRWLPLFDDPKLWNQVARISLAPIGVIE